MHLIKRGPFCTSPLQQSQESPSQEDGEEDTSENSCWPAKKAEEFRNRSTEALAPGYIPEYRQERQRKYPKRSGLSVFRDGRQALNEYHQARFETRKNEALTPGKSTVIQGLPFLNHRGSETSLRPTKRFQKRVWNPYKRRYEWTTATTWRKKAMLAAPKEVVHTNSLHTTEKVVLLVLYDSICPYELHVNGRFVVRGVTLERIAASVGCTPGHVCKVIQSLEAKGFLKKWRLGSRQPNLYVLASYHNGQWTFAALLNRSGRSRAQSYLGKGVTEIDWEGFISATAGYLGNKPRRGMDEAEAKLRRDRRRQQEPSAGLKALGLGVDWRAEMQKARRRIAMQRHSPPPDVENSPPGG